MHFDDEGGEAGQDYYLKPMNCPFHILIFRSRLRSYRELPLRLFEFGTVYRYEKSRRRPRPHAGAGHDAGRRPHLHARRRTWPRSSTSLLDFVLDLLRDYGLDDFYLELSTKPAGKAVGTDEEWDEATEALRQAASTKDLELVLDEGGGAFYGPKISVQARDAIGRTWQMSTIQVDFQTARSASSIEYVGADNERHRPIMIHRALFGSIERFFGVLRRALRRRLPGLAGAGAGAGAPGARRPRRLRPPGRRPAAGRRASGPTLVEADEPLGARIRKAKLEKLPYVLVVGDDDVEAGTVGVNARGGDQPERDVPVDAFVERLAAEVAGQHGP